MLQLLNDTLRDPTTRWVLWADLRTMISNPAFVFPIVKSYEEAGAELVVFGNKAGLMAGDSWSEFSTPTVPNSAVSCALFR